MCKNIYHGYAPFSLDRVAIKHTIGKDGVVTLSLIANEQVLFHVI